MAKQSSRIKGITIEIDGQTQELQKSLQDVDRKLSQTQNALKDVNRLLKFDPQNTVLLEQKQQLLAQAITQSRSRLTELENAFNKLAAVENPTEEQVTQMQALQREIEAVKANIRGYETQQAAMAAATDDTTDSTEEESEAVRELGSESDKSGKKVSIFGDVLKANLASDLIMKGLEATWEGIKKIGSAAISISKDIVQNYADYEQLVGGVETLFGDSATAVMKNADQAFRTAGLSANDYMETVTSFSASLLQSLGGDTEAAASLADQALVDMADNANKMGSSMESIQNAYAGFAKQNYTMLDNLKLGYGGTKTEMERLLADASAIAGVEFNIDSYADVIQAIHVMQESMGIAGTTAVEGSTTISGSINQLQASISNLLTGLGTSSADVGELVGNVITNFETVVQNILPILMTIVAALPALAESLSVAIGEMLPVLLEAGTSLFNSLLQTLIDLLPELIPVATDAVINIADTLIDNLPMIVDSAIEIILTLTTTLIEHIPDLVQRVPEIVMAIAETLIEHLPEILEVGIQLISSLIQGIFAMAATMVIKIAEFWNNNIVQPLEEKISGIWEAGLNIVKGIWDGISGGYDWIIGKLSGWVGNVLSYIKSLFGIHSPSTVFAGYGEYMVEGLAEGLTDNVDMVDDAMDEIASHMTPDAMNMDLMASNTSGSLASSLNVSSASMEGRMSALASSFSEGMAMISRMGVYLDDGTLVGHLMPNINRSLGQLYGG